MATNFVAAVNDMASDSTWRCNSREMRSMHHVRMLLCRMVVTLPDRPGSLGRVTTLLGRLGVDIRQVLILGREGESVTDEFTVAVPGHVIYRCLPQLLEELCDIRVLSVHPMDEPPRDRRVGDRAIPSSFDQVRTA